jgi:hypothetical protein
LWLLWQVRGGPQWPVICTKIFCRFGALWCMTHWMKWYSRLSWVNELW